MNGVKYFAWVVLVLTLQPVHAQVTLDECYSKARNNYPLVEQYGLIRQAEAYNLSNAARAWLPQVSFSAKATWQSEVIELPFNMPGVGEMDKDQYQATLEVNQTLWDGGTSSARRHVYKATAVLDESKYESDMFAIRERINQLFFGILLLDEQLKLNQLLLNDLATGYQRVEASYNNGVATQSDLDAIRVEQIKAGQMKIEIIASRKSYISMLAAFTGEAYDTASVFVVPEALILQDSLPVNRPEMLVFDAQSALFESQKQLIHSATMPKLSLFAQGGYGKPGLNMLSNEFSPFFIGGIRLSWSLGGFYTRSNELQLLSINQSYATMQKETFEFNTQLKSVQQNTDLEKFVQMLASDDEMIRLRVNIQRSTEARVENGTATAADLLRDINAVHRAKADKMLHQMQWLQTMYQLKNTVNL